jgi:hypothetical protein
VDALRLMAAGCAAEGVGGDSDIVCSEPAAIRCKPELPLGRTGCGRSRRLNPVSIELPTPELKDYQSQS